MGSNLKTGDIGDDRLRNGLQPKTGEILDRLSGSKLIEWTVSISYSRARVGAPNHFENVVNDAVTYTNHLRRKAVTALDVVYALKRQRRTIYGFN